MEYAVQIDHTADSVAGLIAEIWGWVERERIKPPVFRYRMRARGVALRLEFDRLTHAVAFQAHFPGAVLLEEATELS